MDVIGEIPCDLSLDIIGYPVRAILPDFMQNTNANIIDKELNERKESFNTKQWAVFENSYWVKIQPQILKKFPLMKQCVEELNEFIKNEKQNEEYDECRNFYEKFFEDKGFVIQQYHGHSVLECLGPLIPPKQKDYYHIPIAFDENNKLFVEKNDNLRFFDDFPPELISHIVSYCDFEFVRSVSCCISRQFYTASMLPSCYHAAVIPSILLDRMLKKGTLSKMLKSLKKCKRVDMYSLICEGDDDENEQEAVENTQIKKQSSKIVMEAECNVKAFHLEFVSKAALHIAIFSVFDFNESLKILKLTQCGNISEFALAALPNNLEELYLMNTVVNIASWSNLKSLRSLIITTSPNLHSNTGKFLEVIVETLPAQILESLCIWDGEEGNKLIIKQLVEQHNEKLHAFGIGGRICLYHPFSVIFSSIASKAYLRLEMVTISLLSTNEIRELVQEYGHQLRILELYCPFVMEEERDIYQWLLSEENVDFFCGSLVKLEVLMVQAFAHHMKRYMNANGWKGLKMKFREKFMMHRKEKNVKDIPLILFDFGMDLNKIPRWTRPGIKDYLVRNQNRLELNYGEGA